MLTSDSCILDSAFHHLSLITFFSRFDRDFIKHVHSSEGFGDTFRFMLGERMLGVNAGYLKHSVVEQDDAERAERDARRDLYVAHVVYAKAPGLLNPVFDERVAQGMFGF